MKQQSQKSPEILDILPRDTSRQAVLKTLRVNKAPLRTRDLLGEVVKVDPNAALDAKSVSEIVKSAIREGLVDVAGEGADLKIQLTPYGSDVAENIK